MKHVKVYEKSMFEKIDDNEKYIKFIRDKFDIRSTPSNDVELFGIYDSGIRIIFTINKIDANELLIILNFFKSCDGKLNTANYGNYIVYELFLSNDFLKELDIEIDALKYNI